MGQRIDKVPNYIKFPVCESSLVTFYSVWLNRNALPFPSPFPYNPVGSAFLGVLDRSLFWRWFPKTSHPYPPGGTSFFCLASSASSTANSFLLFKSGKNCHFQVCRQNHLKYFAPLQNDWFFLGGFLVRLDCIQGTAGPWHIPFSFCSPLSHSCWMWNTQSPLLEITQVGGEEMGASPSAWASQNNPEQMPPLPSS